MTISLANILESIHYFIQSGGILVYILLLFSTFIFSDLTYIYINIKNFKIKGRTLDEILARLPKKHCQSLEILLKLDNQKLLIQKFEELRLQWIQTWQDRIKIVKYLIVSTPLLGLLGTVFGMTYTFKSLSTSEKSNLMIHISKGISEALITTQTGLIIAICGFIVLAFLKERLRQLENHIYYLEVLMIQNLELMNAKRLER